MTDSRVNDYERIARVIRFLDAHHAEQPDLARLAAVVNLSPFHFQRLFSAWAGVTPKDFLQCLTLNHLKSLLRNGGSIHAATFAAGLSSPSRAHDLCVGLEAATPGEMKSGGAGLDIAFGFTDSPFGTCLLAENARGICHLSFLETEARDAAVAELFQQWPAAELTHDDRFASKLAARIFSQNGGPKNFRAFLQGTAFQVRVWRALLEIPPGNVTTYSRLAAAIGQPTAARAVGNAVGQNPLAFLIPCHRVIRATSVLGGYRWGPLRKRAMLGWEAARHQGSGGIAVR